MDEECQYVCAPDPIMFVIERLQQGQGKAKREKAK